MNDVVIITGSARGIGRELALSLSTEHGYKVYAGVRKEADLEEWARLEIDNLTPIMLDVTKSEQLMAAAEKVRKQSGDSGVKCIITCQGSTPVGLIEHFDIEKLDAAYDVQLNGNIRMFQAFGDLLRKNGDARFVMLSSPMNYMGLPTMGSNALNRGATEGLANTLRLETAKQGISISTIWPLGIRGGTVAEVEQQLMQIAEKTQSDPDWEHYADCFASFKNFKQSMAWNTDEVGPEVVTPAVIDAITNPTPEFRYVVGKGPANGGLPPVSRAFYDGYINNFWPK